MKTDNEPNIFRDKVIGDIIFLFRDVSTNNPTKKHIINAKTGKAYCGWVDDYFTQVLLNDCDDDPYSIYEYECCQKCLKSHKNNSY